jgi:translation elongation factor EF-Tu-like GTPase
MDRHIEVTIRFLTYEEGGRRTPHYTGYRPQFFCDGIDSDAEHEYPDGDVVNPGDTARAYLRFLYPPARLGKIYVGMPFAIREGSKTVAEGTVTSVIDPRFSRDAN